MLFNLVSMSTAENKYFLDSSFNKKFNGVIQKRDIYQRQQDLCNTYNKKYINMFP